MPPSKPIAAFVLALLVVALAASTAWAFEISWSTCDAGGGASSGSNFSLVGTIGQPDAGAPLAGSAYRLTGGFWATGATAYPGDCDADGDLDLADYACFADCLTGPDGLTTSTCEPHDLDSDGDVDLLDFAGFQRQFQRD